MYGERHLQAQPVADLCELEVLIGWTWSLRLRAYTIVGPWSRRVFLGGLLGGLGGHRGAPQREVFWEAVLKPFGSSPARPFRVSRGGFIGVRVAVFRPRFVAVFRPRIFTGDQKKKSFLDFFGVGIRPRIVVGIRPRIVVEKRPRALQ